ncbi:class I SAM-dependent methyltransferase [Roseovarius spongiae]|uniref:Class I SAM-dependent methyltransferase n=1 Tax=Roseovarius spongiae TaxID=2320272 RepID=A0A3A8ARZ7_9RHOB|nr:class I SAM-dependent methyltransferase [Roseovarius spongiae]RKF12922.1 class I SAM-dependent methyltransferase [Roseovarius spongiae]
MTHPRLSLALSGGLDLPETGRIAVLAPRAGAGLDPLPRARCHVITGFAPDYAHFIALGYDCATAPEGDYAAAMVFLPRARAEARALIAEAAALTDGPVIVDGAKTDGIESALKELRRHVAVNGPISKAHGKLFWFAGGADLGGWLPDAPVRIEGRFTTAPGVFSADGIDLASRYLVEHLPSEMGGHVIDLGAGWGYLSARALERDRIARIDLVEASHAALECARINVRDDRAHFHWADAREWEPDAAADAVIMNPPFHTGRSADPDLGRAFIKAAAGMLKPAGQLWMVANRHLPYERTLAGLFGEVVEVAGDTRFKVLNARRPARQRR